MKHRKISVTFSRGVAQTNRFLSDRACPERRSSFDKLRTNGVEGSASGGVLKSCGFSAHAELACPEQSRRVEA